MLYIILLQCPISLIIIIDWQHKPLSRQNGRDLIISTFNCTFSIKTIQDTREWIERLTRFSLYSNFTDPILYPGGSVRVIASSQAADIVSDNVSVCSEDSGEVALPWQYLTCNQPITGRFVKVLPLYDFVYATGGQTNFCLVELQVVGNWKGCVYLTAVWTWTYNSSFNIMSVKLESLLRIVQIWNHIAKLAIGPPSLFKLKLGDEPPVSIVELTYSVNVQIWESIE